MQLLQIPKPALTFFECHTMLIVLKNLQFYTHPRFGHQKLSFRKKILWLTETSPLFQLRIQLQLGDLFLFTL